MRKEYNVGRNEKGRIRKRKDYGTYEETGIRRKKDQDNRKQK
jgi:hypothetical protein